MFKKTACDTHLIHLLGALRRSQTDSFLFVYDICFMKLRSLQMHSGFIHSDFSFDLSLSYALGVSGSVDGECRSDAGR